jgi:FtsZ-binding cell division protein ZapB
MDPLENAVDRLLQRNAELKNRCELLLVEQQTWQTQRQALLAEVEAIVADLALLREQQA